MPTINKILENIKGGQSPIFKELYGSNEIVIAEQVKRYTKLVQQFSEMYKSENVELFSSPGRTEIGGNHTDHQLGRVLAGAVNIDNIAVVSKNDANVIRINSDGYSEFQVSLNDLTINESEFYTSKSLVKGINARMKELGYEIGGFDACINGKVPNGSGLSSSASFEVLIGAILNHLYNNGKISAVEIAKIGQWAENNFFGKPCGLMDQTACSVGGFITIDFKDKENPVVKSLDFNFQKTGYSLIITNTGGDHAKLNDEYASLPIEMCSVAKELGKNVLREISTEQVIEKIPKIRAKVGDRALLRSIHFQRDNQRVVHQVKALETNDFNEFLKLVIDSGYSSYMYNQNIFTAHNTKEQGIALALGLSDLILNGHGAWRVHGGGFAGTIQAFVPNNKIDEYISTLEHVFGKGKCYKLSIRSKGAIKVEL